MANVPTHDRPSAWWPVRGAPDGAGDGAGSRADAAVLSHRVWLRGHRMHYVETGRDSGGPLVVLVHGLASDAMTWIEVVRSLGRHAHVLALDMLGCGGSGKPRGADYSVAAHAARVRDLLDELGLVRTSLVGHSFGGGVAMSFAQQFPERTERLALIASGGLGPELGLALRVASLPGTIFTANALAQRVPGWMRTLAREVAIRLRLAPPAELTALADGWDLLADADAREAFLATLRGAVNWSGQQLSATECFPRFADLPILLIAGRRDGCIPYRHALNAHRALPSSQLEILEAGHFPHRERPREIGDLLTTFLIAKTAADRQHDRFLWTA